MRSLRSLKSFFRRVYRKFRRNLSKKELIIILSFAVVLVASVAVIIVLKLNSKDAPTDAGSGEDLDISIASSDGDEAESPVTEETTIVETATAETKVESTAETTVLSLKEDAKDGYLNRCVFLGDSRTVAMVNYGFINDDAALAQIGISHPSFAGNTFINNAGKEYTLKSYLASHQAPVIYVALGVNGINDPSEDHYKKTYNELVDKIIEQAPNSNVVIMSIGPVNDNGPYKKTVQNSWIVKYNDFLLNMAKDKHIFYLDIAEVLTGSDGQVKPEYNGGDGLHYSGSGCQAILDYIVQHPVPGIADDGNYVVKYIKPNPNRTKVTMDDGSGIDEAKLQELMNMMTEITPTPTPTSTPTATVTQSNADKEKEEQERRAKEEADRKAKEEADRKAKEEADRKAKEEADRKAKEDADRKAREEAEKNKHSDSGGNNNGSQSGGDSSGGNTSQGTGGSGSSDTSNGTGDTGNGGTGDSGNSGTGDTGGGNSSGDSSSGGSEGGESGGDEQQTNDSSSSENTDNNTQNNEE